MCKAVEAAGADGISLCNTFQACAIDLEKRRPVFNNTFAGLSGPAIRPIALRMVWQAVGAVNIPVIGLGGILTGREGSTVTLETENGPVTFEVNAVSGVQLCDDEDLFN